MNIDVMQNNPRMRIKQGTHASTCGPLTLPTMNDPYGNYQSYTPPCHFYSGGKNGADLINAWAPHEERSTATRLQLLLA